MYKHQFTVTVECETEEQAKQVIAERIGHDEDYGFAYKIDHTSDFRPSYKDAIREAKDLTNDCDKFPNHEYCRGVVELIAYLFDLPEEPTSYVYHDLGLDPNPDHDMFVALSGNLSEGFRVYGLFDSFDAAADATDGAEVWIMQVEKNLASL